MNFLGDLVDIIILIHFIVDNTYYRLVDHNLYTLHRNNLLQLIMKNSQGGSQVGLREVVSVRIWCHF